MSEERSRVRIAWDSKIFGLSLRLPVSASAHTIAAQIVDYTIPEESVAMLRTKKQSSEAAVRRLGDTPQ